MDAAKDTAGRLEMQSVPSGDDEVLRRTDSAEVAPASRKKNRPQHAKERLAAIKEEHGQLRRR